MEKRGTEKRVKGGSRGREVAGDLGRGERVEIRGCWGAARGLTVGEEDRGEQDQGWCGKGQESRVVSVRGAAEKADGNE